MTTPTTEDPALGDWDLVQGALRNDSSAQQSLIRRLECVPRIVAALNQRSGFPFSEVDQAELSQEIVLRVWKRLGTFEGRARIETWVYKYCFYAFMNRFRKKLRWKAKSEPGPTGLDRIPAPTRRGPLDFEDLECALNELDSLSEKIMRLKHYQGLTFREIAARLEISTSLAKAHHYKALDTLRLKLARARDSEQ